MKEQHLFYAKWGNQRFGMNESGPLSDRFFRVGYYNGNYGHAGFYSWQGTGRRASENSEV